MENKTVPLYLLLLFVLFVQISACSQNGEETEGAKWDELVWDKDKWN